MVRIGTVWDGAVEAARTRASDLLPIAAATIFLPAVLQAAIAAYLPARDDPGRAVLLSLAVLALGLLSLWGGLVVLAMLARGGTAPTAARTLATARLPAAIGVTLVTILAASLIFLPVFGALAASGVKMAGMGATPGAGASIGSGLGVFVGLYSLVAVGLLVWLAARLLPISPVILHERLGLRAIPRTFRMTRGMGWRLVGALLLFGVVVGIASSAAQLVFGLLFRLLLGASASATAVFLAGVASAAVSTLFSVLAYAFLARLYAALSGQDLAGVFEDARAPA